MDATMNAPSSRTGFRGMFLKRTVQDNSRERESDVYCARFPQHSANGKGGSGEEEEEEAEEKCYTDHHPMEDVVPENDDNALSLQSRAFRTSNLVHVNASTLNIAAFTYCTNEHLSGVVECLDDSSQCSGMKWLLNALVRFAPLPILIVEVPDLFQRIFMTAGLPRPTLTSTVLAGYIYILNFLDAFFASDPPPLEDDDVDGNPQSEAAATANKATTAKMEDLILRWGFSDPDWFSYTKSPDVHMNDNNHSADQECEHTPAAAAAASPSSSSSSSISQKDDRAQPTSRASFEWNEEYLIRARAYIACALREAWTARRDKMHASLNDAMAQFRSIQRAAIMRETGAANFDERKLANQLASFGATSQAVETIVGGQVYQIIRAHEELIVYGFALLDMANVGDGRLHKPIANEDVESVVKAKFEMSFSLCLQKYTQERSKSHMFGHLKEGREGMNHVIEAIWANHMSASSSSSSSSTMRTTGK